MKWGKRLQTEEYRADCGMGLAQRETRYHPVIHILIIPHLFISLLLLSLSNVRVECRMTYFQLYPYPYIISLEFGLG
jgi:hypothetical protein